MDEATSVNHSTGSANVSPAAAAAATAAGFEGRLACARHKHRGCGRVGKTHALDGSFVALLSMVAALSILYGAITFPRPRPHILVTPSLINEVDFSRV